MFGLNDRREEEEVEEEPGRRRKKRSDSFKYSHTYWWGQKIFHFALRWRRGLECVSGFPPLMYPTAPLPRRVPPPGPISLEGSWTSLGRQEIFRLISSRQHKLCCSFTKIVNGPLCSVHLVCHVFCTFQRPPPYEPADSGRGGRMGRGGQQRILFLHHLRGHSWDPPPEAEGALPDVTAGVFVARRGGVEEEEARGIAQLRLRQTSGEFWRQATFNALNNKLFFSVCSAGLHLPE